MPERYQRPSGPRRSLNRQSSRCQPGRVAIGQEGALPRERVVDRGLLLSGSAEEARTPLVAPGREPSRMLGSGTGSHSISGCPHTSGKNAVPPRRAFARVYARSRSTAGSCLDLTAEDTRRRGKSFQFPPSALGAVDGGSTPTSGTNNGSSTESALRPRSMRANTYDYWGIDPPLVAACAH
jgi:hypothetical protein